MPIIASRLRKHPFTPLCDWPEDCTVQWGGRGVVLSEKGSYGTAFFEAFPSGKGFFRGEGASIEEAERACFEKYAKFAACDHAWGRGFKVESRGVKRKHGVERPKLRGKTAYTNGGAICKKCKAFASMFQPITRLGAWKEGPSIHDLTMAAEGHLRPIYGMRESDKSKKYTRQTELRLRAAGVDLPPTPDTPADIDMFAPPDAYVLACRKAVVDWYLAHQSEFSPDSPNSMSGLFSALDHGIMESMVREEMEARAAGEDTEISGP